MKNEHQHRRQHHHHHSCNHTASSHRLNHKKNVQPFMITATHPPIDSANRPPTEPATSLNYATTAFQAQMSLQFDRMQGASAYPAASRPSAPCWATSLRESLQRHRHNPTRRLAADDCWYTWEQFAVYYRQDAQPMWEAARQREICNKIWSGVISIRLRYFARRREMAIWSRVVWRNHVAAVGASSHAR